MLTPWLGQPKGAKKPAKQTAAKANANAPKPAASVPADKTGVTKQQAVATSKAKPTTKPAPKSKVKVTVAPASSTVKKTSEKKPRTMTAPRKSGADDLKLISGVGPKLEGVLNDLGFWHFDQVAKWTQAEVDWVDSRLPFKGRIVRDNWIAQASKLAK